MAREIEPGDALVPPGYPDDRVMRAGRRLPVPDPDDEPGPMVKETAAPALGYSILANLGDEKQITVQCFVDSEDDLVNIHRKVDRALEIVDRQKAKYRLKDLRKEVEEMQATLQRQEDDLNNLETAYELAQESRKGAITEARATLEKLVQEAQARGRAKPVGAEAAQANNLKREMENISEELKKAETDRNQARQNMAVNIGRFNDAIAKKQAEIAECEALVNTGG